MADYTEIALQELRLRGAEDAQALAGKAVAGEVDGTYLVEHRDQIPTWRARDFTDVPVGTPYRWEGLVYKLWQQHDATGRGEWSPDKAVSLWDICHTTDPKLAGPYTAPQGSRGLWQPDECCVQFGHIWRNRFADNAYGPDTMPERWEDLGTVEEVQTA